MIGIAIATATAGIVVGTITLTGLGLMMTEFVEFVSGGNVIAMLILIARRSRLMLGMGIPTTANYILVATLMAPVVVELGAQAGLAIPLIAVHLFVFYFGIMADITPPVGLAAFAAAAISSEDPIATGFQGALYSLRTAILPFVFIFNPEMLLIDIDSWCALDLVIVISTGRDPAVLGRDHELVHRQEPAVGIAPCCWSAALRCSGPDWWLDQFYPPTIERAGDGICSTQVAAGARRSAADHGGGRHQYRGRKRAQDREHAARQSAGAARCGCATVGPRRRAGRRQGTITNVAFGSYAKRIGLEAGYEVVAILEPAPRPSPRDPGGDRAGDHRGHRVLAILPAPQTGAGGGLTREGGR